MGKLPYYKQVIIGREYVKSSIIRPVNPEDADNTKDEVLDTFENVWNEYYVLYSVNEFGEYEFIEDSNDFSVICMSFMEKLYDLYVENFDPAEGEPVSRSEWEQNDYPEVIKLLFPPADNKGKE